MITKLGIDGIEDPLLVQSLYNEVHQRIVKDYFEEGAEFTGPVTKAKIENISSDELNILRYACGYVACKLLKRYEKKPGEIAQQYVNCLGEMAVEGESGDVLAYTKVWQDKINRGGLFPLSDEAFHFFVQVELCVRTFLPHHVLTRPNDKEAFKRNVHSKISEDDDVQFYWTLLSQDIDEPKDAELLLEEIIKLWVTVRGYSIAGHWMEVHKKNVM